MDHPVVSYSSQAEVVTKISAKTTLTRIMFKKIFTFADNDSVNYLRVFTIYVVVSHS